MAARKRDDEDDGAAPLAEDAPDTGGGKYRTKVSIKSPDQPGGWILAGSAVTSNQLPSGDFDRMVKEGDIVQDVKR